MPWVGADRDDRRAAVVGGDEVQQVVFARGFQGGGDVEEVAREVLVEEKDVHGVVASIMCAVLRHRLACKLRLLMFNAACIPSKWTVPKVDLRIGYNLALLITIIFMEVSCAAPLNHSIFLQSQEKILQTVYELANLGGEDNIDLYQRILGDRLIRKVDSASVRQPDQVYYLNGSDQKKIVEIRIFNFEIHKKIVGQVSIEMAGISQITCFSWAKFVEILSAEFEILPSSPFFSFSFELRHRANGPILTASKVEIAGHECVNTLGIYYMSKSDEGGPWR